MLLFRTRGDKVGHEGGENRHVADSGKVIGRNWDARMRKHMGDRALPIGCEPCLPKCIRIFAKFDAPKPRKVRDCRPISGPAACNEMEPITEISVEPRHGFRETCELAERLHVVDEQQQRLLRPHPLPQPLESFDTKST